MAIAFATDPRGASHSAKSYFIEKFGFPAFGYEEKLIGKQDEGKGKATSIMQDYAALFNSLKICHFVMPVVNPNDVVACLNAVTGWDMDISEFMQAGERISNVQRLYDVRLGLDREHDTIPDRIATMKFEEGGGAGYVPNLDMMLDEYYDHRNWSRDGIPRPSKLKELSLEAEEEYVKTKFPEL
jgi:aldehyde:ferredoxin oxidoreductase